MNMRLNNFGFRFLFIALALSLGSGTSLAAIATIQETKGNVICISAVDGSFQKAVTGLPLEANDMIQTQDGETRIRFMDGALLHVKPWSTSMIQEHIEKDPGASGVQNLVRRVTCFVGTLWFKSGVDKSRKNILQTPTAVAALRSSEMKFGYDNISSYIMEIEGAADVFGPFLRGDFPDFDAAAAQKNDIHQQLTRSYQASTTAETLSEKAEANIATLTAIYEALLLLASNPYLSDEAQSILTNIAERIERYLTAALKDRAAQQPTSPGSAFEQTSDSTNQTNQLNTQSDPQTIYQMDKEKKPVPSPSF